MTQFDFKLSHPPSEAPLERLDTTVLKQFEELSRQSGDPSRGPHPRTTPACPEARRTASICSGCKKIRDVSQQWRSIETYIAESSEATFSHGLCPECLLKYFPGRSTP